MSAGPVLQNKAVAITGGFGALAQEFKDRGVTVNAVLPSILDTAANRADMPQADFARWVEPRALARVIVFLLSPDAAPINGALIPVKGRT
jgi:NAD(P)-dependent dehydrogenase (short-subunit alcohol dehydrogenase family)